MIGNAVAQYSLELDIEFAKSKRIWAFRPSKFSLCTSKGA